MKLKENITPIGTPLADGICGIVIKQFCEGETVLQPVKNSFNNSEVDQPSIEEKRNLRVSVYVLNMREEPLMPTSPVKARILLKQNKATVKYRSPFTIQLKYPTGETKQNIKLGVDSGYQYIGLSVISDKKELFSGTVEMRMDVSKKIQEKAMYRKKRRSRLWYRPPRFLNRRIKKGWLAPSIQHKLDTHIRIIKKIEKILPISEIIIEVASFDIQKIKNPDIKGKQYQQGEQYGFYNIREYIFHRDDHKCQHCKGKKKDKILVIHHINGKKEGATNRPEELMTLCLTCHNQHHDGIDVIPKKKLKQFKGETFMTIVRWKLVNFFNCKHTYGHITKSRRIKLKLKKSHINDAFVIVEGTNQERCRSFLIKQIRRNNRSLQTNRKGFKRSIRKMRYKIQPFDLIKHKGQLYRSKGTFSYGRYVCIADLKGNNLKKENGKGNKYLKSKEIEIICYGKGLQFILN